MAENRPHLTSIVVEYPSRTLSIGAVLASEPVIFGGSDATAVPDGVTNWTFFDGPLCAILLRGQTSSTAVRTAVLVAPGLAITATHVLHDDLEAVLGR